MPGATQLGHTQQWLNHPHHWITHVCWNLIKITWPNSVQTHTLISAQTNLWPHTQTQTYALLTAQTGFICDHTRIQTYPLLTCPTLIHTPQRTLLAVPRVIPNTLLTPTWAYHSEMLRFSVRNPLSGLPNVQHTLFWPEFTNHRSPTLALIS